MSVIARRCVARLVVATWTFAITTSLPAAPPEPPQPAEPSPAAPTPSTGDAPSLAGPRIQDREAESLVRTDIKGKLVRLDVRPEQAALDLLAIDFDRRERARQALEQWKETVAQHLVDNVDLVRQYTEANRAGDKAAAKRVGEDLFDRFDAAKDRDPLLKLLEPILAADELVRLHRLVDEYWDAWITAEIGGKKDADRDKVQRRLAMGLFQGEAVAAYGAFFKPLERKVEAIVAAVDPTPEQRDAIQAAMVQYVREGRLHPDDTHRHALARRIYDALDDERRVKLLERAVGAL